MNKKFFLFAVVAATSIGAMSLAACSDDSSTSNGTSSGNPINPGDGSTLPTDGATGDGSSGGDASCSKPANCFCGTPTTQKEFLNRCTNATALPVNLTYKPASTANIP